MELDEDQRTATNNEICQQLVQEAPTPEIRAILSIYTVDRDKTEIYYEIKARLRPDVQATAEYLGLNSSGYNPTLAKAIIMKIDSYLLSTCAVCYKLYCTPSGAKPLFSCKRCGQGCHHDCYQNLTPLPGIKFYCSECDDDAIHTERLTTETILTEITDDPQQTEDGENEEEDDDDDKSQTSRDTDSGDDELTAGNNTAPVQPPGTPASVHSPDTPASVSFRLQNETQEEHYIPSNQEAYLQLQMRRMRSQNESAQPQNHDAHHRRHADNDTERRAPCNRYRRGVCPHGISGRTLVNGRVCQYEHLRRCQKYCQFGTDSKQGCTKGRECEEMHPILCKFSRDYRCCYNLKCRYNHLKFTRRYRQNQLPQTSGTSESQNRDTHQIHQNQPHQNHSSRHSQIRSNEPNRKQGANDVSFLENTIHRLQTEMKEFMVSMESKLQHIPAQATRGWTHIPTNLPPINNQNSLVTPPGFPPIQQGQNLLTPITPPQLPQLNLQTPTTIHNQLQTPWNPAIRLPIS